METSGVTPASAIQAPDLAELVSNPGPFVTVYLTTDPAIENAAQQSEARWQSHRDRLAADGAPEPVLEEIDAVVPDAHLEGAALAVVGGAEANLHIEHHPVGWSTGRSGRRCHPWCR